MRWAPGLRELAWLIERPAAHRGLHDRALGVIENTRSAFAAAMARGYAIECDLQLSADGEAMVFHDATLDRLTQERGRLIDRSAEELAKIPLSDTRDRMQTLSELARQVAGRTPLVIELKSHWDGTTRLAARAVEVMADYFGPFALMSFDPDLVTAVRILAPGMARGIVADRVVDRDYRRLPFTRRLALRNFEHLARTQPHFVAYHAEGLPFGPPRMLRASGVSVICWTVKSPKAATRARRYADQITFEGFLP